MKNIKIFGIGLSRTGTSSLTYALRILGYKACHFPRDLNTSLEEYDALTDTPIARDYKRLDVLYPGSKFILTVRDIPSWLKSMEKHFMLHPASTKEKWIQQLRLDLYQTIDFDSALLEKSYIVHLETVKNYFKNRDSDLLIMNINDGDGWKTICPFLSKPIPTINFPKINTTAERLNNN